MVFTSTSVLIYAVDNQNLGQAPRIDASGNIDFAGDLTLVSANIYVAQDGDEIPIADYATSSRQFAIVDISSLNSNLIAIPE